MPAFAAQSGPRITPNGGVSFYANGYYSPNGYGKLKVSVTPVALWANQVAAGGFDQWHLGTNALAADGARSKNQHAAGSALDLSYASGSVTADIGATPLGFLQQSVIGGVEYAPLLSQNLRLHAVVERRAVTDSLLSYAGAKDPATGTQFGGVTRTRTNLSLQGQTGVASYYVSGGGGLYRGRNVGNNTEYDAAAGVSVPVFRAGANEIDLGLNLVYFGFEKNLSGFSLGQGGYFSPKYFGAALVPITFKAHPTADFSYSVGGSLGVQTYAVAANPPGWPMATTAGFGKGGSTGLAGGASAETDYRVKPNLHIGARGSFQRTGNFTEGTGLLYAHYTFTPSD